MFTEESFIKAVGIYTNLLQEIKFRIEAIDDVLANKVLLRGKIAEETCYLQLRMICETIALGCLVMHGDIGLGYEGLRKEYKASYIIKKLERWNSRFYPTPLEQNDDLSGGVPSWVHLKDGYLSAANLVTLWEKYSGEKLHRGSAKSLTHKYDEPNFSSIQKWRNEIVNLLNRHIISSLGDEQVYYFIMNDGNGNVASNLFQKLNDAEVAEIKAKIA